MKDLWRPGRDYLDSGAASGLLSFFDAFFFFAGAAAADDWLGEEEVLTSTEWQLPKRWDRARYRAKKKLIHVPKNKVPTGEPGPRPNVKRDTHTDQAVNTNRPAMTPTNCGRDVLETPRKIIPMAMAMEAMLRKMPSRNSWHCSRPEESRQVVPQLFLRRMAAVMVMQLLIKRHNHQREPKNESSRPPIDRP